MLCYLPYANKYFEETDSDNGLEYSGEIEFDQTMAPLTLYQGSAEKNNNWASTVDEFGNLNNNPKLALHFTNNYLSYFYKFGDKSEIFNDLRQHTNVRFDPTIFKDSDYAQCQDLNPKKLKIGSVILNCKQTLIVLLKNNQFENSFDGRVEKYENNVLLYSYVEKVHKTNVFGIYKIEDNSDLFSNFLPHFYCNTKIIKLLN
jgi:hypothetical protein